MNRRLYLKSTLALGGLAAVSFSLFKWFSLNTRVNPADLLDKRLLIAELAEMIIPRTATPGAKDAGVENYIINVLINCNSTKQQHKFYYGIIDLEAYSRSNFGKEFLKCSKKEKEEILQYFSVHSKYPNEILNKVNNKFFGKSFFSKLKELTVEGYCLSEAGATKGLAYDYIPGSFQACIPLQKNQKSWATK